MQTLFVVSSPDNGERRFAGQTDSMLSDAAGQEVRDNIVAPPVTRQAPP
jgi:hypothetical protein